MAIYRLRCAVQFEDTSPKNQAVINPVFETTSPLIPDDVEALCDDLADQLPIRFPSLAGKQTTVTAYNVQTPKPNYPVARVVKNDGVVLGVVSPPELAVVLSFYSGQNVPRRRGRLYIPNFWITGGGNEAGEKNVRAAPRAQVGALAGSLANLGGTDVDWVVYSKLDNDARPVSNWWVSDAWAQQRSRGIRSTARTEGTVSE
jgi:hypothetical protein